MLAKDIIKQIDEGILKGYDIIIATQEHNNLFDVFDRLCAFNWNIDDAVFGNITRRTEAFTYINDYVFKKSPNNSCVKCDEWMSGQQQDFFVKAVDAGFMIHTDIGYKWIWGGQRGCKARLAYFIHEVFNPSGIESIPYKRLEAIFGVSRLERAVDQVMNAKNPQKWREEIDNKVFYD